VAQALQRSRKFKFAEVDGALPPAYVPNDPQYPSAWHLPKISAPTAWDNAKGIGVTIAILDSGIDLSHPDLMPQLVPGWNFYDGNNNVADVHGHGTAVAGVAAAAANNGLGVSSVSFQSKIMPMRVTDPEGYGYFSMMADAINRAADNGARVANLSFLGVSMSSTVTSAAQYMRSKGGVVVIAGGNTGALGPTAQHVFTSVSATDSADARELSSWATTSMRRPREHPHHDAGRRLRRLQRHLGFEPGGRRRLRAAHQRQADALIRVAVCLA
jgi:subtilisin family serine protease